MEQKIIDLLYGIKNQLDDFQVDVNERLSAVEVQLKHFGDVQKLLCDGQNQLFKELNAVKYDMQAMKKDHEAHRDLLIDIMDDMKIRTKKQDNMDKVFVKTAETLNEYVSA